jgi:hypothetical protein
MVFNLDESPPDPFAIYKVHYLLSLLLTNKDPENSANPEPPSNLQRSTIPFPGVPKPPTSDEDYQEQLNKQKHEEVYLILNFTVTRY